MAEHDPRAALKNNSEARVYLAELESGDSFMFMMDSSDASEPLVATFEGSNLKPEKSPFRTADADAVPWKAAELLNDHFATTPEEAEDRIAVVEETGLPEIEEQPDEEANPAPR